MLWRKTFIHLISSISKRKKLSVSMRNQTSDLLIPGFKPLSLSQRRFPDTHSAYSYDKQC